MFSWRKWPILAALAVSFMLSAVPRAPAADASLIAAATKEGTVIWYVSLVVNQIARPMAAAFEKKYPGIEVKIVSGSVDDLIVKLLNEGQAHNIQADVSHGAAVVSEPLMQAGLIAKYVPDSAKNYPDYLKDPDGYLTAETTYFLVPAINTSLVADKDVPKTYEDLLDPKWKGKIAWTNALTTGGPPEFIGTVLLSMGEDKGMDYLRKLAKQQIVNVAANQRVVLDQVIAGEYPLALATFNTHSAISAAQGAPVRAVPLDPVTTFVDNIFLINGAPHPNAGKLFIDFVASPEGQEVFRDADYLPADPAVPAKDPTLQPAGGHFKALVLPSAHIADNMKKWTAIYNDLFK